MKYIYQYKYLGVIMETNIIDFMLNDDLFLYNKMTLIALFKINPKTNGSTNK